MRQIAILLLSIVSITARAVVIDQPPTEIEEFPETPWSIYPPDGRERVPAEILEQLSQPGVAGLSQAVLGARSVELRGRLAESPDDPFLLHALGTVTYHQGGVREALALWNAASRREPNLAPADLMADVQEVFRLLEQGAPNLAQGKLKQVELRYADQPHFHLIRAEQAMRGRNFVAAGESYRRAHALAPDLYITNLNLARYLEYTNADPESAGRYFKRAAELAPDRAEVWSHLGNFQFRQGQSEAALSSLRTARSLDPQRSAPERRLGDLSAAAGRYEDAVTWYRAALAAAPSASEAHDLQAGLGDFLLRLGRHDEARQAIEEALKAGERPQLLFALGTIDEAQGRLSDAERRYRQVLTLAPGNPLAANNLAMLLVKSNGLAEEAQSLAAQARRALPNNAYVEGTFGCTLALSGRNADAIKVLQPVVERLPEDTWSRYCLAASLQALGRTDAARPHFEKVLALDPSFPRYTQIKSLLK